MKKLFELLLFVKNYKLAAFLNIFFNLLSSLFSLFSITLAIPFLNLIFLTEDKEYEKYANMPKPNFAFSVDYLTDQFNYYFGNVILNDGKETALIFLCTVIVVMFLFKNLFRYLAMYSVAIVRTGIIRDIRKTVYQKLLVLPLSFYSEEKKGDILSRMTSDVQEIEHTVLKSLEMIFKDPINIILFLSAMFFMSAKLTLFVLILLPVSGVVIGRTGKSLKRTAVKGQAQVGILISWIEESLGGLRVIKAFNAEGFAKGQFNILNERFRVLLRRMYHKRDLASPLSEFLGVGTVVIVMWYGGGLVLNGQMEAAKFIGFILFFSQIISPSKSVTDAYFNVQKGAASAERIQQIVNAEEKIIEKENAESIDELKEKISFEKVNFSYEESQVLSNINLEIKKGETIALVGPSGGGKSTIADLIPRFYEVNAGAIKFDGVDIRDLKLDQLRSLLGVVNQSPILFNDTIYNNIAFGKPESDKESVIKAAQIANAHEFISQLPNGYETSIGDAGDKLSGGQKQRISIARAILHNPPVLILDEATSALDTESEKLVQDALDNLMKNRTSLVIAHRLSTIQNANRIIVLEAGKIIEDGTHLELMKHGGVYKKLQDLQSFS